MQKGAIPSFAGTVFSKKSRMYLEKRKEECKFITAAGMTLSPYELVATEPKCHTSAITHARQAHKTTHGASFTGKVSGRAGATQAEKRATPL